MNNKMCLRARPEAGERALVPQIQSLDGCTVSCLSQREAPVGKGGCFAIRSDGDDDRLVACLQLLGQSHYGGEEALTSIEENRTTLPLEARGSFEKLPTGVKHGTIRCRANLQLPVHLRWWRSHCASLPRGKIGLLKPTSAGTTFRSLAG